MILARLIRRRPKRSADAGQLIGMPGFDRDFYLARNPDVAESGTDPLRHYLKHGWREGREPSSGFTGQRYLAENPDVQAADINPLVHYLNYGLAEGRTGACATPGAVEARDPHGHTSAPSQLEVADVWLSEPTRLL